MLRLLVEYSCLRPRDGSSGHAEPVLADWSSRRQRALAQVDAAPAGLSQAAGVKPAGPPVDRKYFAEIPVRNPRIRGPVNFFRNEYGRWWLTEKTGDEHFENKVRLAKYGYYMLYEALNAADGKRNVARSGTSLVLNMNL